MKFSRARSHKTILWSHFCGAALLLSLLCIRTGNAQDLAAQMNLAQEWPVERTGVATPAGLAYAAQAELFFVAAAPGAAEMRALSALGQAAGSARLPVAIDDPLNLTYDDRHSRLIFYQTAGAQLVTVGTDAAGQLVPGSLNTYQMDALGLHHPQGMAIDPLERTLIFLDAAVPRLVILPLQPDGGFADGAIVQVDLHGVRAGDLRGIAYDPTSGHVHLVSPGEQRLYEISLAGEVIASYDLSRLQVGDPQALVFAPSGDQTDDPAQMSLYLADRGSPRGRIIELSFTLPSNTIHESTDSDYQASLVRTTDTAAYSPPSPDPSGLAYLVTPNTLLISDGEVEEVVDEITHFEGVNIWEVALDGSVVRTANLSKVAPTVVPMTDEPTGVAWNPGNGHYYFSDDNALRVFDLNPGVDGALGTADDSWTSFSTSGAANGDPEGIAFDSWHERLFVVDGTNREVYQYTLTGSLVEHFDVQQYGVIDPEGIEFNPLRGTLFILGNAYSQVIVETTLDGSLLRTMDVSASAAIAPAGLAYAPASDGSGRMRFYIVDRGVDNDIDPNMIDGKMYELTAPAYFNKITPANGATGLLLSQALTWSTSPGATGYQYCYDTSDDGACSNWIDNGISTSASIDGLALNTTYFWQVRAWDGYDTTYADGASTAYAWFSTLDFFRAYLPLTVK